MENLTNELENTQDETTLPEECEKSEKALESISDESVITHYAVINLFVIAIIALITAISFIVLTDDEKVDDISNPLTFKTFASGKFTSNLEESYIRKLPFPYEFKTAGNRLAFAYGIGNQLKTYKRHEEIVLVADADIEEERQQVQENIELSLEDIGEQQEEEKTTTAAKKTTEKKTETGAQRVTTTKRQTTTEPTPVTSQETTSLTTTNNNPPEVTTTTTIPPYNE